LDGHALQSCDCAATPIYARGTGLAIAVAQLNLAVSLGELAADISKVGYP
jgi:hypothetical protein